MVCITLVMHMLWGGAHQLLDDVMLVLRVGRTQLVEAQQGIVVSGIAVDDWSVIAARVHACHKGFRAVPRPGHLVPPTPCQQPCHLSTPLKLARRTCMLVQQCTRCFQQHEDGRERTKCTWCTVCMHGKAHGNPCTLQLRKGAQKCGLLTSCCPSAHNPRKKEIQAHVAQPPIGGRTKRRSPHWIESGHPQGLQKGLAAVCATLHPAPASPVCLHDTLTTLFHSGSAMWPLRVGMDYEVPCWCLGDCSRVGSRGTGIRIFTKFQAFACYDRLRWPLCGLIAYQADGYQTCREATACQDALMRAQVTSLQGSSACSMLKGLTNLMQMSSVVGSIL